MWRQRCQGLYAFHGCIDCHLWRCSIISVRESFRAATTGRMRIVVILRPRGLACCCCCRCPLTIAQGHNGTSVYQGGHRRGSIGSQTSANVRSLRQADATKSRLLSGKRTQTTHIKVRRKQIDLFPGNCEIAALAHYKKFPNVPLHDHNARRVYDATWPPRWHLYPSI